jgi:hypothetical protein
MIKILHNVDGEKVSTFNTNEEFTHFMRKVAIENEDEDLSITCFGEALDYLNNYCPNLTFVNDVTNN